MIVLMVFCRINVNAMETWNRIESGQEEMPLYSAIDALNKAFQSNNEEACTKYAKMVAKSALSEATLDALRQRASDHWLTTLNPKVKERVYQHMPKTDEWKDKRSISYDDADEIKFAPRSSKMTVISRHGKEVGILDAETGILLQSYKRKSWQNFDYGRVCSATLSSDDAKIAIASEDKTAIVAQVDTGDVIRTVEHTTGVYSATFSSDDTELITLTRGGVRRVTNIATGDQISRVRYYDNMPHTLDTISPDGKTIVIRVGGKPGRYGVVHGGDSRIINADTGRHVHAIGHRPIFGRTFPIFTSDSRKVVAVCDYDPKKIKIIDLATSPIKEHVLEYDDYDNHFYDNSIAFSPDGSYLGLNRGNGLLDIVDTHSGLIEHSLEVSRFAAKLCAFSSDNRQLAVAYPQQIKVFHSISAKTLDQALLMHLGKHCTKKKQPILRASLPWVATVADTLYNEK
jgi:WD40 repeat protein